MSDVKWIKITTGVFDNWKIKHLKAVPELGHTLVCIWFELLCMAGSCNEMGMIIMSNRFVATDEIIAETFHEDLKLVQMALRMFEELGMIEITNNNAIQIANWTEYQSAEKLDIIKEYEAKRKAKYRDKQKQISIEDKMSGTMSVDKSVDSSISISLSNTNNNINLLIKNIILYLNNKTNSNYKSSSKETVRHISARIKEGFTYEDFCSVIDFKTEQWLNDEKMRDFLRPSTLFGTKFESYLNAAQKVVKTQPINTEIPEETETEGIDLFSMTDEEYAKFLKEHPDGI